MTALKGHVEMLKADVEQPKAQFAGVKARTAHGAARWKRRAIKSRTGSRRWQKSGGGWSDRTARGGGSAKLAVTVEPHKDQGTGIEGPGYDPVED
jgi:hypothetical protein